MNCRGSNEHDANHQFVEDDARLMSRVRQRDARAFEALYDRHHRLVYGIAMRLMAHRSAAEDVTQAVFLKIWSDSDAFAAGNFAAWVGRVTRNCCMDILRAKSRHAQSELIGDRTDEEDIEETAFAKIDAVAVRRALNGLPEAQRHLIDLAYFAGMTQERIAQETGVPLGTVKTRIRAGLQRLRQLLDEVGRP